MYWQWEPSFTYILGEEYMKEIKRGDYNEAYEVDRERQKAIKRKRIY